MMRRSYVLATAILCCTGATLSAGAMAQGDAGTAPTAEAGQGVGQGTGQGAKTPVILPRPPEPFAGVIGTTVPKSTAAYPRPVTAPDGAPNILLVMTDDVGFAASSTFGGPVPTPALDRLAKMGLRYNRFHTTAMCSPTRAALLTGRNHHAVGTGMVTGTASGFPGYWGIIPRSAATVAEVLKLNGYNTAFFGKHHNIARGNDDATAGPFDQWPTGLGFEYFYGFIGGDTNQWKPKLYRGTNPAESPRSDTEMLDHFLVDDAIGWLHNQQAAAPDKPFFIYLAPGSAHAPQQAPADWIAKFKGRFDRGWDVLREESLARQKAQGIVPANTRLTPRPAGIPAWSSLTLEERKTAARMMEVFAAMLAYQDNEFGRLVDELERTGEMENTLIIFIEGDNGGAPEGDVGGSSNEVGTTTNGVREDAAWLASIRDRMGGPDTYEVFPVGWAWATNTPFQWTKMAASHLGGTRNGMVISWPGRIAAAGEVRSQFSHVNDIMPTILEAAGIAAPDVVNGAEQQRIDGTSLLYSFADAAAAERHRTQYFELLANRAIYSDGWLASTTPKKLPWNSDPDARGTQDPDSYAWELYDLRNDFSQANDLARKYPERLAALKQLWMTEALANQVLPLDDSFDGSRGSAGRIRPRPRSYIYWGKDISVAQSKAPPLNSSSFVIDADVVIPASGAEGVLIASGSFFGGWSFYFDKGRPAVTCKGSQQPRDAYSVMATEALPAGPVTLGYRYMLTGEAFKGGRIEILVNGRAVASGPIGPTGFAMAGRGETFDIGRDTGEAVVPMPGDGRFSGAVRRIEFKPVK